MYTSIISTWCIYFLCVCLSTFILWFLSIYIYFYFIILFLYGNSLPCIWSWIYIFLKLIAVKPWRNGCSFLDTLASGRRTTRISPTKQPLFDIEFLSVLAADLSLWHSCRHPSSVQFLCSTFIFLSSSLFRHVLERKLHSVCHMMYMNEDIKKCQSGWNFHPMSPRKIWKAISTNHLSVPSALVLSPLLYSILNSSLMVSTEMCSLIYHNSLQSFLYFKPSLATVTSTLSLIISPLSYENYPSISLCSLTLSSYPYYLYSNPTVLWGYHSTPLFFSYSPSPR